MFQHISGVTDVGHKWLKFPIPTEAGISYIIELFSYTVSDSFLSFCSVMSAYWNNKKSATLIHKIHFLAKRDSDYIYVKNDTSSSYGFIFLRIPKDGGMTYTVIDSLPEGTTDVI